MQRSFEQMLHGPRENLRVSKKFLASKLKKFGFAQFLVERCKFRLRDKQNISKMKIFLGAHVDNVIIANLGADYGSLCRHLRRSFPTNNVEELTYYRTFSSNRG